MDLEKGFTNHHTKQYSVPLKKEKYETSQNLVKVVTKDVKISLSQEDKQNLDAKVNQYVEKNEEGLFHCKVCGKLAKQKIHVKNHIEAMHMEGIEIPCPVCGKIFRSRHGLSNHRERVCK